MRKEKNLRMQRGFTMIEILIAIALIAVLGTTVIILIDPVAQFKKGRDVERKSELSQIQTGLELYRSDQGTYPASLPDCDQPLIVGTTSYIQKMPCDPKNTGDFVYTFASESTTYTLTTCLENLNDPKKDATNNSTLCAGGTTDRSYTLTNP